MTARHRKILLSFLLIGVTSVLAGFGTFSAFSSTTTNSGNSFAAGTVFVDDNDAGSAMYTVSNQAPWRGHPALHQADLQRHAGRRRPALHALGHRRRRRLRHPDGREGHRVARPSPAAPASVAQSTIYNGELDDFASAHGSYANGVAAFPGAQTQWNQNDTLVYRFTLTLQDDNNANGGATPLSSGSHAFTWEARNQ